MSAALKTTESPREIVARRRATMLRSLFGELIGSLIAQVGVTDIVCNSDGKIFVTATGRGKWHAGHLPPLHAEKLIYAIAKSAGEHVARDNPSLAAELVIDDVELRVQAFLPPATRGPAIIIRKAATRVYTLQDYLDQGVITASQRALFEAAICDRKNILICGGTGTGKTTFMNALLEGVARLTPDDRVCGVERTRELQCKVADQDFLRVSDTYQAQRALQDLLRAFPTRLMVGEVRGPEALEMLYMWNTGHDGGFCTIHSKTSRPSPRAALLRLEQAAALAATTSPLRLQSMIGEVVDLVVCISRTDATPAGRIVSFIGEVLGWDGNDYITGKDALQ